MRKILLVAATVLGAWSAPAGAQTTATLPVTCAPGAAGSCVRATPVVNPDGSSVGATPLPAGSNTIGGVVSRGTSTLATGQISVGTTSTQVVAARVSRATVTMTVGAANTCAFGNTGVTTTTGFPLQPVAGATLSLDTSAAVFAVCSAATTISFVEQF